MRIITGSARGTRLLAPEGETTRPTAERVKEAVFSMIQFEIEGRRVLDLFGGSGQLALEALSRGAASATICDTSPEAIEVIKRNAQKTHLYEKCAIYQVDSMKFAARRSKDQFDIIFIDPPYASGLQRKAFETLAEHGKIAAGGLVICESAEEADYLPEGFRVRRHTSYSKKHITVFEKVEEI